MPDRPEAAELNPHAGTYLITDDPREREASIRAGDRSVAEFPYYVERYGERGRLFGHSDSAWIARLAGTSAAELEEQIRWLGTVLSSRGMPQWLLTRHLRGLHQELCAAVPERCDTYARLLRVAEGLQSTLDARLPAEAAESLSARFDETADAAWSARLPHMGRILAAAVADESVGLSNAVDAVVSWAGDAQRFPRSWVEAVHATVAAARAAVVAR
jgi:hypothetical protein